MDVSASFSLSRQGLAPFRDAIHCSLRFQNQTITCAGFESCLPRGTTVAHVHDHAPLPVSASQIHNHLLAFETVQLLLRLVCRTGGSFQEHLIDDAFLLSALRHIFAACDKDVRCEVVFWVNEQPTGFDHGCTSLPLTSSSSRLDFYIMAVVLFSDVQGFFFPNSSSTVPAEVRSSISWQGRINPPAISHAPGCIGTTGAKSEADLLKDGLSRIVFLPGAFVPVHCRCALWPAFLFTVKGDCARRGWRTQLCRYDFVLCLDTNTLTCAGTPVPSGKRRMARACDARCFLGVRFIFSAKKKTL